MVLRVVYCCCGGDGVDVVRVFFLFLFLGWQLDQFSRPQKTYTKVLSLRAVNIAVSGLESHILTNIRDSCSISDTKSEATC